MTKYYTRACNFFYGHKSRQLVKKNQAFPLCNNNSISFNQIELLSRDKKTIKSRVIDIKSINKLPSKIKKKVNQDLEKITRKREFLTKKSHVIMGVINMTPDSFSDGGKFNSFKRANQRIKKIINSGSDIIDIGGESTRPGSKIISQKHEFARVKNLISNFKKKFSRTLLSIDTRKSQIIDYAIKKNADIINDISCFQFDKNSFNSVKNKNVWKIIHHMQGTPQTMQINPRYNHVLLDIYDFFEKEIKNFQYDKHKNKIILDPGIGFGKKLKHNLMILNKISIFHSLGFPILIGTSRKKFINQISGKYDTKERIGGTLSSIIYSFSQGVKIFRVHNVE
jgi:dihydropteroate synthase